MVTITFKYRYRKQILIAILSLLLLVGVGGTTFFKLSKVKDNKKEESIIVKKKTEVKTKIQDEELKYKYIP